MNSIKKENKFLRFMSYRPVKIGRTIITVAAVAIFVFLIRGGISSAQTLVDHLNQGGYLVQWTKKDGQEINGLVYNSAKGLKYDLYIPSGLNSDASAPLFLFIHGGSWNSGRRQDISYACKFYAKHGCITATLDYSLISKERPEVTIYTMLDEITECIGAIKGYLSEHGYKTPKIAISGFSAGGHLALLYSYSRAAESPIPIAFVFEKVGPSDFSEKAWGARTSAALVSAGSGQKVAEADLESPESQRLVASLSPASFITKDSVPTIFAYGGKDDLVKGCHRTILAEALDANGVDHIAVDFPNSHHGMWDDPDKTKKFRKAVLSYCKKYMSEK